ncbi:MAG: phytanoyl-CoA dioxygenase family protein [Pseudomonadota bacterium]
MGANRLTPQQIERYHEDGIIVPDLRVSESWLGRMRDATDRLLETAPDYADFAPAPHVPNCTPGVVDREWLDFAGIPEVLDILEQLIGPDFLMWGSSYFGKPALVGKETPWHQDGEYWPIKPMASVTLWFAIDPSTRENGCLRIIPGSHRSKSLLKHRRDDRASLTLNQTIDDDRFDTSNAIDVELEPGQFSIHDVYIQHASRPNVSTKRRASVSYRFMPTTSHFDHVYAGDMARTMGVTDMSERPLYLMRGIDRDGRNNLEVGHAAVDAAYESAESVGA